MNGVGRVSAGIHVAETGCGTGVVGQGAEFLPG